MSLVVPLKQHNTQSRITLEILKQYSSNLHQQCTSQKNRKAPTMLLPWQHSWLQSLSVKNQISPFATFQSGTEGLARNTHGSHIVLTLPIRLLGVGDPCLR